MNEASGAPPRGSAFKAMATILIGWGLARIAVWSTAGGHVPPEIRTPTDGAPNEHAASAMPIARTKSGVASPSIISSKADYPPGPRTAMIAPLVNARFGTPRPSGLAPASVPAADRRLIPHGVKRPTEEQKRRQDFLTASPLPNVNAGRRDKVGPWRGYGYIFWREGKGDANLAQLPTYGGSQLFARISRRLLGEAEGPRLDAYGRLSKALDSEEKAEPAIGITYSPATPAGMSVTLHVERRFRQNERNRTAMFLSGGFLEDELPAAAILEGYAAAGTVLGTAEGTIGFYEGQLDVKIPVASEHEKPRLFVGAKLSGGAQEGDGRLDVGPALTARLPVGETALSVEAGWRERIAGRAEPGSGPAVTATIGF